MREPTPSRRQCQGRCLWWYNAHAKSKGHRQDSNHTITACQHSARPQNRRKPTLRLHTQLLSPPPADPAAARTAKIQGRHLLHRLQHRSQQRHHAVVAKGVACGSDTCQTPSKRVRNQSSVACQQQTQSHAATPPLCRCPARWPQLLYTVRTDKTQGRHVRHRLQRRSQQRHHVVLAHVIVCGCTPNTKRDINHITV